MNVTELSIKTRASYETDAGQLVGTVILQGENGKQEIKLTSKSLSDIFAVISQQVIETAKANASQVKSGMNEAVNGPLLAQSASIPLESL